MFDEESQWWVVALKHRSILGVFWGPSDPNDMYPIPTQNMRFEAKLICWQRIPLLCDLFGKVSAKFIMHVIIQTKQINDDLLGLQQPQVSLRLQHKIYIVQAHLNIFHA